MKISAYIAAQAATISALRQNVTANEADIDLMAGMIAETGEADLIIRIADKYPVWTPDDYTDKAGCVRLYGGYAYRCIQPHNSTDNPDWSPEGAPSLWAACHGKSMDTALPYLAPTGVHDAYMAGEYMVWTDGTVYRCMQATVYSPAIYTLAWERVADDTSGADELEEPTTQTYAEWVQPTGSHDAYAIGDRVTYQGKVWESTAGGNTWAPGVYGWKAVSEANLSAI